MPKLYFRFGTMNSSKTANLIMVAHNYINSGKKVLIIKPSTDSRKSFHEAPNEEKNDWVTSRSGIKIKCDILLGRDESIYEQLGRADSPIAPNGGERLKGARSQRRPLVVAQSALGNTGIQRISGVPLSYPTGRVDCTLRARSIDCTLRARSIAPIGACSQRVDCTLRARSIDCILVDEAQFLTETQVDELRLATYSVPVICYGLRTDSTSHLFEGSKRLLEIADSIEEIKTICDKCNKKAIINSKYDENGIVYLTNKIIDIGAEEKYKPLCWFCWKPSLSNKMS